MQTFTGRLEDMNGNLWGYHIMVPDEISRFFLDSTGTRVVCSIGGMLKFQCALMPKGDGSYFVMLNKENRRKLQLELGDEVEVTLTADESKYGLPMPEEFSELLQQDPDVDRYFHALTPGKQRALLHQIGSPKRPETRLKKAVVIAEFLKANNGQLDFKALNRAYKEWNSFK